MIKKLLLAVASLLVLLVGTVAVLYATNTAPRVPELAAADAGKPYVVKLHAQWCPVCRLTKGVWSEIEEAYAGRVNMVVLDFTNEANTEASRATARRLGLDAFFDEWVGATGIVAVLDGRTKEVSGWVGGVEDFHVYGEAIDAALAGSAR